MKKIIFLDIDGVCNDHSAYPNGYCGTDRECVRHLNRVLAETDAFLVISSAWRYMVLERSMTVAGFENLLLTHVVDCRGRILGVTCPDEVLDGRGLQIRHWLNENGGDRPYVVVDDLDLGITEEGHPFVRTDGAVGLTDSDAGRMIAALRGY